MKKKALIVISILLLIGSFALINWLQQKNFTVFNDVDPQKIEQVKLNRIETEELAFTALLCNEIRVPFDENSNTFFVPLDMRSLQWEKLEFVSGQPEYQIIFNEDVTDKDKQALIGEGEKIKFLVYDGQFYAEYALVFSGLPIIDLSTNEGFYAAEEITGKAVFYDTDFTLHGITASDYNGHIRGNTSRMFPKKGYKINLTSTNSEGVTELNKLSLFGMRKDDDWILHALYNDESKIRDQLSMKVWESFGAGAVSETAYYGPKMTYVEVFADNSYCGLYGLMEPVDAKQLDLTEEDYSYKRKNPGSVQYKYEEFHKADDPYAEVEGFEIKEGNISENSDFWKPMSDLARILSSSKEEFLKQDSMIINEKSALNLWLFIQLITGYDHIAKNVFYIAKYNEDVEYDYQFYFAPWDMDLTWGNVSVGEINAVYTGFEWESAYDSIRWDVGSKLLDNDYHGAREYVQNLYFQLRKTVLADATLEQMILELDHEIRDSGAFARDKERWPEGVHAEDCRLLLKYAKERMSFLDEALFSNAYYDE